MVQRSLWLDRRWTFDLPVSAAPGLVERLRGTPARVERRLEGLGHEALTTEHHGHWSIQENVGHLLDLEPRWIGRIDDIAVGRLTLQETDLENRQTAQARHNEQALADIFSQFELARAELVSQLEQADEADWLRSARHPQLQVNMRLLDLAFFVAEHDDHHLATVTDILRIS
ncbi:MAG: DinB family protein [Gemmatimonadota bacterium]